MNNRADRKEKGMSKDFILVLIGQIISLFGNAVLRFALPLHLLNVTDSPAVFGTVSALSFLPMLLMSPIGGVLADRINKKKIMAGLDFFTAGLMIVFFISYGKCSVVLAILIVLTLLYGISGAYQPSVQASVPVLVREEKIVSANAVINMVSSLSGLLGPVIGGICYSIGGLAPILMISAICFFCSAVMELFIQIPTEKQKKRESIFDIFLMDAKESLSFLWKKERNIGRLTGLLALFNLFLSSLLIIGIPVLVTKVLKFEHADVNQMLGYVQGLMAFGGIAGGILSAGMGERLSVGTSWKQLFGTCMLLIPIGTVLLADVSAAGVYAVLCVCCFGGMALSTMFSVGMMAYVQKITPGNLIGKVIAWIMTICSSVQPIGQAMYGALFEKLAGNEWIIFAIALAVTGIVTWKFYRWTEVYRESESFVSYLHR